jgi:hypothetical protein
LATTAETDFVEVRLLREALEGVVARQLVTPILFEALEPYGNLLPTGAEGLLDMVRGPLAEVVSRRIGGVEADEVVRRAEQLIAGASGGLDTTRRPIAPARERERQTAPPPVPDDARRRGSTATSTLPPPTGRERDATELVPTTRDAVTVLVVAGGGGLALRLTASLGSRRVAPFVLGTLTAIRDYLSGVGAPNILLVDATDFPPIAPEELSLVLRRGPRTMVRAIWGADLPYGRSLVATVDQATVPVVGLERSHGVDPLLDLIRSRRV